MLDIARQITSAAWLAALADQPERAARLLGATKELRKVLRVPLSPSEQPIDQRIVASTRAKLGGAVFAAVRTEGQAMTLEQAVADALDEVGQHR